MIDWQRTNNEYLAHSLNWLRLRLTRLAQNERAAPEIDSDISQAALAIQKLAERKDKPALPTISQLLGLSTFEQQVLLLCAAMELDTRIPALCALAQDQTQRPYPTFALAMALFEQPAWEALSPEHPLRYWQLIEVIQPAGQPLINAALKADERIVNAIKGLNHIDHRLTPYLLPFTETNTLELPATQKATVEQIKHYLSAGLDILPVIQLTGSDPGVKQQIAQQAANELGLLIYRLSPGLLPASASELYQLLRLWQRETVLQPVTLYLDVNELSTDSSAAGNETLLRFAGQTQGLVFLAVRDTLTGLERVTLSIEVQKPTALEQIAAWRQTAFAASAEQLAGQFNLGITEIHRIARLADANGHDIWQTCLIFTRPRLEALAESLIPKAAWEDLILPADELAILRQLPAQVRSRSQVYEHWGFRQRMNRGLGITALFAGESGTGKTMAAEVLANELRLNLYRIDLSAVVSKYIGETEKNLRRLFDAAEDGGAILFFDEADALFGKRSEVKDSHDRYANIEINYLLQRMEAYRGLAILATNLKNALDPAFMRRLRFVVNFPFPNREDRKRIWQTVFPPQTPLANLDFDQLARLTLTGGSIHNAAVNAAFLAAEVGKPVQMEFIMQAARTEMIKVGRPVNELEFNRNGGDANP